MRSRLMTLFGLLLALTLVAAACGSSDEEATEAEETSTEESSEPAEEAEAEAEGDGEMAEMGDAPSELDIALVLEGVKEEGWNTAMLQALERVKADAPHDLTITETVVENVDYADGERIARDLASSGDYEIIIMHSAFVDGTNAVAPDFPEIAFGLSGSGNDAAIGGNVFWIDVFIHEPAYLMGMIAGSMTETNQLSAVAGFPFPNVNAPVHAFIDGAESVNPDVEFSVTYIESWFDAVKGNESAVAQIAAGSDMIYAERFGPVEAAASAEGVYAFGHFTDQSSLDPEVVLASALAKWDPTVNDIIDAWYAYATEGTAYAAPAGERIVYTSMIDGGSDITELSSAVPEDVATLISETRDAILAGELEVPFDDTPFE